MSGIVYRKNLVRKDRLSFDVVQHEILTSMGLPAALICLVTPFIRVGDSPEKVRQTLFFVTVVVVEAVTEAISVSLMAHRSGLSGTSEKWFLDPVTQPRLMCLILCLIRGTSCLASVLALLHVYYNGLKTRTKVVMLSTYVLVGVGVSVVSAKVPFYWCIIILLDFCVLLQSETDKIIMDRLAIVFQVVVVLYGLINAADDLQYSSSGRGLGLHKWSGEEHYNWINAAPLFLAIPLINFQMIKSYADGMRHEQRKLQNSATVVYAIAEKLADYDLDTAETLLRVEESIPVMQQLERLLRNLRSYRTFLPDSLFTNSDGSDDNSNLRLKELMSEHKHCGEAMQRAVHRMSDPQYGLDAFHMDMVAAFPELELHRDSVGTSGRSGNDEYQRTMGALYSVYCLLRLDIDGKEIFSFGVDQNGNPLKEPIGDPSGEKKRTFYDSMNWDELSHLLDRAGITQHNCTGQKELCKGRVGAMLALTAIHDVMKNTEILPIVQAAHAPYEGYQSGEKVSDHDVALAYILDHFPTLLPSFKSLAPGQRAPIMFTQNKMGFNNGWLVQGEAPPGALFSKFKRAIVQGGASPADVGFYFVHWFTDLAGADPFGNRRWPGAEKFTVKFPCKVLRAFLHSFVFVGQLAVKTEVEVMEQYLLGRWQESGQSMLFSGEGMLAQMRLSLMGQGFEREVTAAFAKLPSEDSNTLSLELARTGCTEQFKQAPSCVKPSGPALLIYYAPALLQKAGATECFEALRILAAVFRAARHLFPLSVANAEVTATIRIDALKIHTPVEILNNGVWHLRRTSAVDAEAVSGKPVSVEQSYVATLQLPAPLSVTSPNQKPSTEYPEVGEEDTVIITPGHRSDVKNMD